MSGSTFHVGIEAVNGEALADAFGDVQVISYVAKCATVILDNAPAAQEYTIKLIRTDGIGGGQVGEGPIVNITANGEVAAMVLNKRLAQLRKWARTEPAAEQPAQEYATV